MTTLRRCPENNSSSYNQCQKNDKEVGLLLQSNKSLSLSVSTNHIYQSVTFCLILNIFNYLSSRIHFLHQVQTEDCPNPKIRHSDLH